MTRSRIGGALRICAGLYLLSLVAFGGLLLGVGRLGIIEHFTFVPRLLIPEARSLEITAPDGSVTRRRLPAPERFTLDGPQGPRAIVLYRDPADAHVLTLFVCPGAGGPGSGYAAFAWFGVRQPGVAVLAVDYAGMGRSAGAPALEQVLDDARAGLRLALERFPDVPLFVVGSSLGTAPALVLAQETPGVVGLVLDSPVELTHEIRRRHVLRLLPPLFVGTPEFFAAGVPESLGLMQAAGGLRRDLPVLVAYGADDPIVDPETARRLAGLLGDRCTLWEEPGRYHALLVTHVSFVLALGDFAEGVLASRTGGG